MATNAVYKVYNGSDWVEYYFKTSAAQVGVTAARKFVTTSTKVNNVAFSVDASGDGASVTINASNINWYGGTKPTTNYLSNAGNIQAALVALDTAAKNALDTIPSGCLTTSNYAATLDSVYQAKGSYQTKDDDLTAIAGISTTGYLKRTGTNTWATEDKTFVETSRKINGKALSSDVTLYGTDIAMTGNYTNVAAYLMGLEDRISSTTQNYAIDITAVTGYVNDLLASHDATIEISNRVFKFLLLDGETELTSAKLNVGDSIYITNEDYPDRWYAGTTGSGTSTKYIFKKLETTRLLWANIASKPTTISGYGITDAYLDGNTVHLGSNSKTFLTAHQDISGKAPNNHASSATTYGLGTSSLYGHVKLVSGDLKDKTAADGMAASQSHTHSQYLTSHQSLAAYATQTWVDTNFVRCTASTTAPTSPSSGDIWIDTNN